MATEAQIKTMQNQIDTLFDKHDKCENDRTKMQVKMAHYEGQASMLSDGLNRVETAFVEHKAETKQQMNDLRSDIQSGFSNVTSQFQAINTERAENKGKELGKAWVVGAVVTVLSIIGTCITIITKITGMW